MDFVFALLFCLCVLCRFLRLGWGLVDFTTGFAGSGWRVFPAPEKVKLDGVTSLGGLDGVEQALASHSTGAGGADGKPPPIRAS